ncbi:hypothetical protein N0V90_004727 [Kalmusia sp. IMI 367209]|nr:hypothetical protein N0V90_004727 [Kalmusia sp. IMI 367209]
MKEFFREHCEHVADAQRTMSDLTIELKAIDTEIEAQQQVLHDHMKEDSSSPDGAKELRAEKIKMLAKLSKSKAELEELEGLVFVFGATVSDVSAKVQNKEGLQPIKKNRKLAHDSTNIAG